MKLNLIFSHRFHRHSNVSKVWHTIRKFFLRNSIEHFSVLNISCLSALDVNLLCFWNKFIIISPGVKKLLDKMIWSVDVVHSPLVLLRGEGRTPQVCHARSQCPLGSGPLLPDSKHSLAPLQIFLPWVFQNRPPPSRSKLLLTRHLICPQFK